MTDAPAVNSQLSVDYLGRLSVEQAKNLGNGQRKVVAVLNKPFFDYAMGTIILINIVVMIIEIDRSAMEDVASSDTPHWTERFGTVVLIIFAIELLLRLFAYRSSFFKDEWNVFDFLIVFTDVTLFFVALVADTLFPVSMLRIFRLAKLARVSKVLRVFPELRMLLASLMRSLSTILWGSCMLCLVLLVWSMVAVLLIHPLNKNIEYDGCERCSRAYSSVANASLTFWQQIVAGDSWGVATIPLIEKHPSTAVFFVPLFLSVGLAVMNLILGVVVSVAQQAKDDLQEEEETESTILKLEKQTRLLKLCQEMDVDRSGELSQEELYAGFKRPGEFRDSMMALGITREDFDVVWAMLDIHQTGNVSYKRLVNRLYKLRSCKTEFTLAYLKHHVTLIRQMLLDEMQENQAHEVELRHKVEEELGRIEKKEDILLECQQQLLEKLQESSWDAHDHERHLQESSGLTAHEVGQKMSQAANCKEQLHRIEENGNALCEPKEQVFRSLQGASCCDAQYERNNIWGNNKITSPEVAQRISTATKEESQHDFAKYDFSGYSRIAGSQGELDDTQNWLKLICNDIAIMRMEIKDMFMNIDRKLGLNESSFSAAEQNLTITTPQRLLAIPNKNCSLFPGCYEKI